MAGKLESDVEESSRVTSFNGHGWLIGSGPAEDHRGAPKEAEKLLPVGLEPVKLVSNGNPRPFRVAAEEKGESKDGEPVNWDRCAISMGAPRTRGRGPAPGNRGKGWHRG